LSADLPCYICSFEGIVGEYQPRTLQLGYLWGLKDTRIPSWSIRWLYQVFFFPMSLGQ